MAIPLAVPAAISAAASVYSAYSSYKAGKAQAAAYREQARAMELKKKELDRRYLLNKDLEQKRLTRRIGSRQVAAASLGGAESAGNTASMVDAIDTLDNLQNMFDELQYEKSTTSLEQSSLFSAARNAEREGRARAVGSILSGASDITKAYT
jgi:hypothetical protein